MNKDKLLRQKALKQHKPLENKEFKSSLDDVYLTTSLDAPSYDVVGKREPSRVEVLLNNLPSKKDMVILQTIIGPPKAL